MSKIPFPLTASSFEVSTNQVLFVRYFTATLVDLIVLNLFAELWHHVVISSFAISLLAAVILQALLKLTLWVEHLASNYFKSKSGAWAKYMRWFTAWAILFVSKFIILEVINFAFGDAIYFGGPMHGVVVFIAVVVVMVIAEELLLRLYRRLA